MTAFPFYIQKAVDLGLLETDGQKIIGCKKDEVETVLGITRIIEKIQPTTTAELEDTTTQESIVLCRVLSAPSGLARELWSALRVAFGIGHGQNLPANLWSTPAFRTIGAEIDLTFLGERNASVINRDSLINQYAELIPASRPVSLVEFNQTISNLSDPSTMDGYGDPDSEWNVALDILRQARVRALYKETLHMANQVIRSDSKLEKNIEFLQSRAMECIGMLRGSIGNQGNAIEAVDALFGKDGEPGVIDEIVNAENQVKPVSTGIMAIDIDMEGGIRPVPGGGRLFTLAARTGVGKTILGVQIAASAVCEGLCVGFISAELDMKSIQARLWSAICTKLAKEGILPRPISVGQIESPNVADKEEVPDALGLAGGYLQSKEAKLFIEAPWGADVDSVVNSMRAMKAKHPELRSIILDHFHCLARHKGAPTNEAAMMEERAYRLMTAAKELDVDLFVLAQMNRVGLDSMSRNDSPQLNEIRGTDALAHVSHAVWIARRKKAEEGQPASRELELWHSKTRGRQAYWDTKTASIVPIRNFQEMATLYMDYSHSSVALDTTLDSITAVRLN